MSTETTPAIERGIEALRNADDCGLDDWVVVRDTLTAALEVEEIARAIADDLYGQNAYLLLAVRRPGESSRDHADRIGQWAAEIVLASVLGTDQ